MSGWIDITDIPAPDLDKLLWSFFKDLRKKDDSDYGPDTVSSFQKSNQRHFSEQKLPFNILKDDAFSRSRSVLAAKRKSLVKEGRGNKPNASCELTKKKRGSLKQVNSEITIHWHCSAPCCGFYQCSLASEPGMKVGSCVGEIQCWTWTPWPAVRC